MSKKLILACAVLLAAGVSIATIAKENADAGSDCPKQCAAKACGAEKGCTSGCASKACPATACTKATECATKECAKSCPATQCVSTKCAKECASADCKKECSKECASKECPATACAKATECASKECAKGEECAKQCASEECEKGCAKECATEKCTAEKCTKSCAAGEECTKACAAAEKCTKACAEGKACTKACSAEEEAKCKAKCPVSGKDADKKVAVDYKGGKVFLCCPGCPGAFEKNTAKYAPKANHQLVLTGQAKQTGCPFSGGKCNEDTTIEVAGTKVSFCCNGCKGKATKAEGDAQLALLFGDKAFEKGFKVNEKKE